MFVQAARGGKLTYKRRGWDFGADIAVQGVHQDRDSDFCKAAAGWVSFLPPILSHFGVRPMDAASTSFVGRSSQSARGGRMPVCTSLVRATPQSRCKQRGIALAAHLASHACRCRRWANVQQFADRGLLRSSGFDDSTCNLRTMPKTCLGAS